MVEENRSLIDILNELTTLIGDTAVSSQIEAAMKSHTHDYVSVNEFNKLKADVERLMALVGDMSVAEQINSVLNR